MKPRQPLPRVSKKRLAANGGKMYSTAKKSRIRKVNPKAKAKRAAGYRKMLRSKEYLAARKEAMARAENRCEYTWWNRDEKNFHDCYETEGLHAHHLRYPKSRPLAATDLLVVCERHHEMLEWLKGHKQRMF